MLIVCEGANTEKQYFEQFAEFHHNSLVDVIVEGGKGVPFSVVQAAKKLRDDAASEALARRMNTSEYQSVWCVFDFDEHPNPNGAKKMATDNGMEVAMSNPCFELWLLLHLGRLSGRTASAYSPGESQETGAGLRQERRFRGLS